MALPDSTTIYIESTLLYFTVLHSIMALFDSTSLYHTLPFLYLALRQFTTLYDGSTWLYFTLLHSTMALLSSTTLYPGST